MFFGTPSHGALFCQPQEADTLGDEVRETDRSGAQTSGGAWFLQEETPLPSLRRSKMGSGINRGTKEDDELDFPTSVRKPGFSLGGRGGDRLAPE